MFLPQAHVTDAYGENAQSLLRPLQKDLLQLAKVAVEKFYALIPVDSKAYAFFERLTPSQFERLKRQHADYFGMLTSDTLTYEKLISEARKIGQVHCFNGVEIPWLIEVYGLYQEEIYTLLKAKIAQSNDRELLLRVFAKRFLQDNEGQLSGFKEVACSVSDAFLRIDQSTLPADNLSALIHNALEAIGSLPGGVSGFFARADANGQLQIEQSYGDAAAQYHHAMISGLVPKISIDESIPAGRGPGGRAWRSGEIIVSDAWQLDPNKAPWREVGARLGFRSSAAVPLLNAADDSIALLSLYSSWPGYFSHENIRGFLTHTQQVMSHALQAQPNSPVVPLREQTIHRELLAQNRVVMHYQPVISLKDGHLIKIEGLARLQAQNGELITPNRFLPAFDHNDLLKLFESGIRRACLDSQALRSQGFNTRIAINYPAEGLSDERYQQAFLHALHESKQDPSGFQLEILETQAGVDRKSHHKTFLRRLQAIGVQIAQDDLGSGHSSLLRLDQYPFDEVKIDQGLVRGALHNPKRALDFILHLTRLAHAFHIPVTVEGLENEGLVEAAAILGADYGQGYQIAKPMPAEQLITWRKSYLFSVNPFAPNTAIGAMAGYLLWDEPLANAASYPAHRSEREGAAQVVAVFIKNNNLQGSKIDRLYTHYLEQVQTHSALPKKVAATQVRLIQELTDHWTRELSLHDTDI